MFCAGQATQAYLEGDKALAKKLGASGRWHAAQMSKAHQLASEEIFRQRNPAPKGMALAPCSCMSSNKSRFVHSIAAVAGSCLTLALILRHTHEKQAPGL